MASFAKLGLNFKVKEVISLADNVATTEQVGIDFLTQTLNYPFWVQTFTDGTRKNFAGIGYTYDEDRDAFIAPKPYASWTLNEETLIWEAPVDRPENEQFYIRDETTTSWIVPPDLAPYPSWIRNEEILIWEAPVAYPEDGIFYIWSEDTTSWIVPPDLGPE